MHEVRVAYNKIKDGQQYLSYGMFAVNAATKKEAISIMSAQVDDFLRLMGGTLVSIDINDINIKPINQ